MLSQGKSGRASSDDNNAAETLQLLEVGGCTVVRRVKGDVMNDAIVMRASIPMDWEERCAFAGFVPAVFHFRPTEWCYSTRIASIGSKSTGEFHHTNTLTMRRSRRGSRGKDVMVVWAGYMNCGLVLGAPGDDYDQPLLLAGI